MKRQRSTQFNPRQYMLSRDFEVYYYSDLHFRSVGSHSHDYYEIYFFEAGTVRMEIDGALYPLQSGDVIVVPPGIEHRAMVTDPEQPYRRFVFWLSRDYCRHLRSQSEAYLYLPAHAERAREYIYRFNAVEFNALRGRLFSLLDEIHTDRFGRDTAIALCVGELLLHLGRLVHERQHPRSKQEKRSYYEAIIAYIEAHWDEELSLEKLANELFISKYYISHLFQQTTGLSIHQYLTKKRLSNACDAIRAGSTIAQACAMCGFQDYSSFYRAFKKEYGLSPAEYRELHGRAREQGPEAP